MLATTIRPATINDAKSLASLAESTFRETFTADNNLTDMALHCAKNFSIETQQQEILDPNCATILAEIDEQLVAFAQVRLHSPKACVVDDRPSELHRLYVAKEWHGQGVAQTVMSQVMSTAAQAGTNHIWLGVWAHNPRAIAFYRKYGFNVVGEHVFQFGSDPQRDLIMMAAIKASC